MFKNWGMHFSPDSAGGGGDVQPFGETGDVKILEEGADEADADEGDDDKAEGKSSDESDGDVEDGENPEDAEEDEEKSKEKEDDDEEEEEKPQGKIEGKPALKAITSKYPNIFKEFPALKDAYFRADAYSEIFPSVDDAREAQEKSDTLDGLEDALVKHGSSLELLTTIKDSSPRGLEKFVENLLPTLYKFDSNLFYKATEPITRQLLWSAKQHGEKTGDKNLAASVQHLANFLFGDAEVDQPKLARKEADPERIEFEKEKAQFEGQKRNEFLTELNNRAGRELVKNIQDGLDPKGVLSDFLKGTITEKVLDEVGARLEKDDRHMARMRSLHARAAKAGFPKAMTDQITTAYLSAAKLLVPVVRAEIKQKAMGKSSSNGNKNTGNRQIPTGGNSGSRNLTKNLSPKQVDWGKTSDLDFLNDKVTLRKN